MAVTSTAGDLDGEADALGREVQPPGRDEIKAGKPGQPRLGTRREITDGRKLIEGDMPGVADSRLPVAALREPALPVCGLQPR